MCEPSMLVRAGRGGHSLIDITQRDLHHPIIHSLLPTFKLVFPYKNPPNIFDSRLYNNLNGTYLQVVHHPLSKITN